MKVACHNRKYAFMFGLLKHLTIDLPHSMQGEVVRCLFSQSMLQT